MNTRSEVLKSEFCVNTYTRTHTRREKERERERQRKKGRGREIQTTQLNLRLVYLRQGEGNIETKKK